jgi:hypothetical protein
MVVSAAVAQNDPAGHATGAVRLRIGQNEPAAHVVHTPGVASAPAPYVPDGQFTPYIDGKPTDRPDRSQNVATGHAVGALMEMLGHSKPLVHAVGADKLAVQ